VIALTRHDDKGFVRNMMQAGAAGYVLKQSPSAELIRAIRSVAGGQPYVDPSVRTPRALQDVRADGAPNALAAEPLAPIEEQVLKLVAASYSNLEIAGRLAMSVDAIATAKTDAMRKLGLTTRLALIRYARLQGWLLSG
jgi:two-component system, NarL family, response regulator NreC